MNQYSTQPEYILEESQETVHMANKPSSPVIDWQALVVDLVQLQQVLVMQEDTSANIRKELAMLVQHLEVI